MDLVSNMPASKFHLTIMQNRSHEDFFCIAQLGTNCYYYAVFDGHGGGNKDNKPLDDKHCVLYLKDYLHHHLIKKLQGISFQDQEAIRKAIVDAFHEVDKYLYEKKATNGSTASIVLVTPVNIIFINLGDSRAIKIEGGNNPRLTFSTNLHNALEEVERIQKAGGYILDKRLNGIYLPSRAFGDFDCKVVRRRYMFEGPMSAHPEIFFSPRRPGLVILGTDGLFDGFSNLEKIVEMTSHTPLAKLPDKLIDHAKHYNSDDDTTCIVIQI